MVRQVTAGRSASLVRFRWGKDSSESRITCALPWNDRQNNPRRSTAVGVDRNVCLLHSCRGIFEFTRLWIAGEIRKEGRRHLYPDTMVLPKNVACNQVVEMQLIHPIRRQQSPPLFEVAIARTQHV